jgi:hypothetical protein
MRRVSSYIGRISVALLLALALTPPAQADVLRHRPGPKLPSIIRHIIIAVLDGMTVPIP